MRPIVKTVGPLAAAVANKIALTQSRATAGPLALNGATATTQTTFVPNIGVVTTTIAVLDKPRRIAITSAGNDAALIFTVVGTNWTGQTIAEALGGANGGGAISALDYATITGISTSGATASTITVGTSAVAGTEWFRLSEWGSPKTSIQVDTAGTVNYTLQQSLDDPNDPTNPVPSSLMTWVNHPDPVAVGASGPIQTSYDHVPRWLRCVLNSGTGAVTVTAAQSGGVLS